MFKWQEPKGTFPAMIKMDAQPNGDVIVQLRNRRSSLPSEIVMPKAVFAELVAALSPAKPPVAKKPTTGIMKPK